jgi:hypothetical protein
MDAVSLNRPGMIRRGRRLEYFTVAWNSLEAAVSIIAGLFAGSISLVGFGLDSAIEVASGAALLWPLRHSVERLTAQCGVELVVGRRSGWIANGSDYRERKASEHSGARAATAAAIDRFELLA